MGWLMHIISLEMCLPSSDIAFLVAPLEKDMCFSGREQLNNPNRDYQGKHDGDPFPVLGTQFQSLILNIYFLELTIV